MSRKPVVSIRWKMMIMFVASGIIAIVGVSVLVVMAGLMYNTPLIGTVLGYLYEHGWSIPLILGTGILLFVASFVFMSSGTLRYMSEISGAVNRIAGGDLDVYIPVQTNDELGRLADDVNQMAAKLKRSIEEEREAERTKNDLITSVSHDLRTPLTSILGYLALVNSDKYEDEVTMRVDSVRQSPQPQETH